MEKIEILFDGHTFKIEAKTKNSLKMKNIAAVAVAVVFVAAVCLLMLNTHSIAVNSSLF